MIKDNEISEFCIDDDDNYENDSEYDEPKAKYYKVRYIIIIKLIFKFFIRRP